MRHACSPCRYQAAMKDEVDRVEASVGIDPLLYAGAREAKENENQYQPSWKGCQEPVPVMCSSSIRPSLAGVRNCRQDGSLSVCVRPFGIYMRISRRISRHGPICGGQASTCLFLCLSGPVSATAISSHEFWADTKRLVELHVPPLHQAQLLAGSHICSNLLNFSFAVREDAVCPRLQPGMMPRKRC